MNSGSHVHPSSALTTRRIGSPSTISSGPSMTSGRTSLSCIRKPIKLSRNRPTSKPPARPAVTCLVGSIRTVTSSPGCRSSTTWSSTVSIHILFSVSPRSNRTVRFSNLISLFAPSSPTRSTSTAYPYALWRCPFSLVSSSTAYTRPPSSVSAGWVFTTTAPRLRSRSNINAPALPPAIVYPVPGCTSASTSRCHGQSWIPLSGFIRVLSDADVSPCARRTVFVPVSSGGSRSTWYPGSVRKIRERDLSSVTRTSTVSPPAGAGMSLLISQTMGSPPSK